MTAHVSSRASRRSGRVGRYGALLLAATTAACAAPVDMAAPPEPPPAPAPVTASATEGHSRRAGTATAGTRPVSAPPAWLEVNGVTAAVLLAPVADDGSLVVPDDVSELGWWIGSAPMGAASGTTLIAGHVDSAEQGLGVFAQLRTLALGAEVTVVDGLGAEHAFVVSGAQEVVKSDLPADLFSTTAARRLALVTCSGPFDRQARRYRDNLIVWAEPAQGL